MVAFRSDAIVDRGSWPETSPTRRIAIGVLLSVLTFAALGAYVWIDWDRSSLAYVVVCLFVGMLLGNLWRLP
jgi:hypothetical protein